MNGLSTLGETFAYKTVSCADLEKRIGRLAANKRIKEPAYQKNYGLFTNEFNARCGGSIVTTIKKPGAPVVAAPVQIVRPAAPVVSAPAAPVTPPDYTPAPAGLAPATTPPKLVADPVTGEQHLIEAQPATSMWSSPWVKGAAIVGALGIAYMLYKRSRR